jgi:hypothetical protein
MVRRGQRRRYRVDVHDERGMGLPGRAEVGFDADVQFPVGTTEAPVDDRRQRGNRLTTTPRRYSAWA